MFTHWETARGLAVAARLDAEWRATRRAWIGLARQSRRRRAAPGCAR